MMITVRWFSFNSATNSANSSAAVGVSLGSGGLRPEAPAPLEGLEGFLEAEYRERRLESWQFLWYDSSFALLCGKSLVVYVRIRPLELRSRMWNMSVWQQTHSIHFKAPYLFQPFPLIFGRKLFICYQAFQQLIQRHLGPQHLLLFRLCPADLFTEGWRGAEVGVWTSIFDLTEGRKHKKFSI